MYLVWAKDGRAQGEFQDGFSLLGAIFDDDKVVFLEVSDMRLVRIGGKYTKR